jgi:hypothetical protein
VHEAGLPTLRDGVGPARQSGFRVRIAASDFEQVVKAAGRERQPPAWRGRVNLGGYLPRPPTDTDARFKRIWRFIS